MHTPVSNRVRISIALLLAGLLLWPAAAAACSQAPIHASINCRDGRTVQIIIEHVRDGTADRIDSCETVMPPDLLTREIARWGNLWRGYFLDFNLTFIDASTEQGRAALASPTNPLDCYYDEVRLVEGWIVVRGTSRDYCKFGPSLSMCPSLRLAPTQFLWYIATTTSDDTLPFWGLLGFGIVASAAGLWWLCRTSWITRFLQPSCLSLIATAILTIVATGLFAAVVTDIPLLALLSFGAVQTLRVALAMWEGRSA